jgi:uncharacterized membrane protein YphA (DoxX/SURF4 family)
MSPKSRATVQANAQPRALRITRAIAGWLVSALLAFAFVMTGLGKLIGRPGMVLEFEVIGIGHWFRYFTGAIELAGAIGLLIPRLSSRACLMLAVVMVGAIVAHLTVLHTPARLPVILLVLSLINAWLRHSLSRPKNAG